MFSSQPPPALPKITAPTAAEICQQSNPSPEAKVLLKPQMTPAEYLNTLEEHKMSVDSVNFLAHGLPPKDGVCWACQSSKAVESKLSPPELASLQSTQAWLKNPTPEAKAAVEQSLQNVDFTGPGSWTAQSALWSQPPGTPSPPPAPGMPQVNLAAAAVAGAVLLAAGLSVKPPMPQVPKPKLQAPQVPKPPDLHLNLPPQPQMPQIPNATVTPPVVDQPKMMKLVAPFIKLGKGVAQGTVTCT